MSLLSTRDERARVWAILTTTTTLCCLPLGMVGDNLTPGTTSGTEPDSFRDTLS